MYEEHFGLAENPFGVNPDPRFLYLSEVHQEALARLTYGIRQRRGFVVITGDVGTGKTTLLNGLLQGLDERTRSVFITNPRLAAQDFLRLLAHGFGLPSENFSKADFLIRMEALLAEASRRGEPAVLVIDEAQNLSTDLLEEIRLLSNLETATEKRLQIILVGQQELNEKLLRDELRQLRQRVAIKYHLEPLGAEDTGRYIAHRLRVAGGNSKRAIFSPGALEEIHRASGGFPRLINNICDNALLSAYSRNLKRVDAGLVRETLADIEASYPPRRALPPLPEPAGPRPGAARGWRLCGAALALTLALLLLALLARPDLRTGGRPQVTSQTAAVGDTCGKVR
jgi:general secretion pathway protein A